MTTVFVLCYSNVRTYANHFYLTCGYLKVNGILVKKVDGAAGEKDAAASNNPALVGEDKSVESRNLASLMELTSALEHLTCAVSKIGGSNKSSSSSYHQPVLQ